MVDELLEAIRAIPIDWGVSSGITIPGGNAVTDQSKRWGLNIHRGKLVKIVKGTGKGQAAIIDSNGEQTLITRQALPLGLDTTSVYVILDVYDPKVSGLIRGPYTASANGAADGSTVICSDLATLTQDYNGNHIIITSGPYDGEARDIDGSTLGGVVNPATAFTGQITTGTTFVIACIRTALAEVAAVEAKLDHAEHGLAALKALLDSLAGGAFYGSYGPRNVEVDNAADFGTILYDPSGNIITVGEITPGTYTIHRIRVAVDTEIVPAAASSEAAGRVYVTYNFPAADWNVGDIFYITFSGIIVTIDGIVTEYPNLFIWGRVVREADVSSKVDTVEAKLEVAQYYDRIFYDSVNGIAGTAWPVGTPQVPSDVIADVITMCGARNLKVIDIHGALTLGATMQHYKFIGHRHEAVADTLALAGQDVDDSVIVECLVSGAQGGAGFLTLTNCVVYLLTNFQGIANYCDLYGSAMSLKDGGFQDMHHCNSVHSDLTITVQAPTRASFKEMSGNCTFTAQDGGVLYIRGFKGTLVIDAMTDGICDIYANGADITINATCIGTGIINIYGNARVTDAHGAGTTVNDYTKETELDAIKAVTDNLPDAGALTAIQADLDNPDQYKADVAALALEATLATVDGIVDNIEVKLDTQKGAIGVFYEQVDAAVNITATNAAETDVLNLAVGSTRYIVRSLRLKCADPGANTVIVRLYELVNDGLTEVDSFAITTANFATYHSLMDMFGLPHLAGDQLQVTVRASAGGPYAVTGQYSHAKTNV